MQDAPLSLAPPGASIQFSGKMTVASGALMMRFPQLDPGRGERDRKDGNDGEKKKSSPFVFSLDGTVRATRVARFFFPSELSISVQG